MELKFGKHKGQELFEIPTDYLEWLLGQTGEGKILSKTGKFAAQNAKLLTEVTCELMRRKSSPVEPKSERNSFKDDVYPKTKPAEEKVDIFDVQAKLEELEGKLNAIYEAIVRTQSLILGAPNAKYPKKKVIPPDADYIRENPEAVEGNETV